MTVAGLVLAAGEAVRFGSAKQLAPLGGEPLVVRALRAQLACGELDRVAVVVGAYADEVRAVLPVGTDVVMCLGWDEGVAASLRAGVAALEDADWIVVTLADQPGVTAEAITAVVVAAEEGLDGVRATYEGVSGHPVALGRALLDRAGDLRGDDGLDELLDGAVTRDVEVGRVATAEDVDTPADLRAISEV